MFHVKLFSRVDVSRETIFENCANYVPKVLHLATLRVIIIAEYFLEVNRFHGQNYLFL